MFARRFGAGSPIAPKFAPGFFEGTSVRAALREVARAMLGSDAIVAITGDPGTGKTTLCRMIADRRPARAVVASIGVPPGTAYDLLREILIGFGVLSNATHQFVQASHDDLLRVLDQFLASLHNLNAQAIVILDDAHQLSSDVIEQVRLLSNPGTERRTLHVILVGLPELDELLARDDSTTGSRGLRRHRLGPLQVAEVPAYIARRLELAQAGGTDAPELTSAALRAIALLAGGVPRAIDTLVDHVVQHATENQTLRVDAPTVVGVARKLGIDVPLAVRLRFNQRQALVAAIVIAAVGVLLWWSVPDSARPSWFRRGTNHADAVLAPASVPSGTAAARPAVPTSPVAAVSQNARPSVAPKTGSGRFLVLIHSFRTADRASRAAADIAARGFPAFARNTSGVQEVVMGPYLSREDAAAAQAGLVAAHIDTATTIVSDGGASPLQPAAERRPAVGATSVTDLQETPIDDLLRRARALVQQPDVRALQLIRDQVALRQETPSATGNDELKAALAQLDRYLDEARRRQLDEDRRLLGATPQP